MRIWQGFLVEIITLILEVMFIKSVFLIVDMKGVIRSATYKHCLLIMVCIFAGINSFAQKLLNEGQAIYNITIDPSHDGEGLVQYKGTYTVYVKGNKVRRELELDNGFRDVSIYNKDAGTSYTLRIMGSKGYAIELDPIEVDEEISRWAGFSIDERSEHKDIIGEHAHKATVKYKNSQECDIFYTKKWEPSPVMFVHFPEIKVMPLEYVIANAKGVNMYFSIKSIYQKPIEDKLFRVPKEYKIVTSDEYKRIR